MKHPLRPWAAFVSSIVLVCALGACANSSPDAVIANGGLSLTLPRGFVDDTAYFVQNYGLDQNKIAAHASVGHHIEPLLQFNSDPRHHRTVGSCMVAKMRMTPVHPAYAMALPALARGGVLNITSPKEAFKPLRPIDPLRPIQAAKLVEGRPIEMIGLKGWQETWRVRWADQPGALQPLTQLSLMSVELTRALPPKGDRVILQAVCFVIDLEDYLGTAMQDMIAVMSTLRIQP